MVLLVLLVAAEAAVDVLGEATIMIKTINGIIRPIK